MPQNIEQDGVGQPSPKPPTANYPQTGAYRTARPQGDMYPRSANHFMEYIVDADARTPPGLNFRVYNIAGTWFEINAVAVGYDGSASILPIFAKLNDPSNSMGDGFFGSFQFPPAGVPNVGFSKPISVRGIPFNKLYVSLFTLATLNIVPFYLHVSYGTDTDLANVDVR